MLKNDNLLLSLSTYHPREGHTPLENFITEAFAWLLRSNKIFTVNFFKELCKESSLTKKSEIEIETQLFWDGYYPDMVISIDESVWIFEHKTYSNLSNNQLDKYRASGKIRFKSIKIILITAFKSQHKQNSDVALTWSQIDDFIIKFIEINSKKYDLTFQNYFSELLKLKGLGMLPALSPESIKSYLLAKDFVTNLKNILQAVYQSIESEKDTEMNFFYNPLKEEKNICEWKPLKEGCIGIKYLKSWRPGVFTGCVINNFDHLNNYKDNKKGIDYSLIISFDQKKNRKINYKADDLFKTLIEEINKKISTLHGYELYEHYKKSPCNQWHPLYIRKSLADIFTGIESQEEQVKKLIEENKKLLQFLITCPSFLKLRTEYK